MRHGRCDTKTFTPDPDRWETKAGKKSWVSSTCYPNRAKECALSAALALLARSYGLDDNAQKPALRTLQRLDEETLRWWWDDGKLPAELKGLLNIFAPEVPAAWLVAYWMGRVQKVW